MEQAREVTVLDINQIHKIDQITDYNTKLYETAKLYIKAGIPVLPILGKALPPKKHNISYNSATRTLRVVEKWFHPDNGKFKGWNLGIATGRKNGVFAVDVDKHGSKNGFDTMEEMGVEMPLCPVATTPSGGKHYYFLWQEFASSSTGKLGPGIDTRGGSEDQCRGHVVAFPSRTQDGVYQWESCGPIPPMPKWVADGLGVPWDKSPPSFMQRERGSENVTDADIEETVPIDQVQTMINHINPDDIEYDDWVRIGMAIKSQYEGDDGLKIWEDWSKHGSRYKSGECRTRWNGFDAMGKVRMATLFFFAQKGGWEPAPTDQKVNKLGQITEVMNKHHAVVVIGNKIRILVELTGEVQEMSSHYHLLSRQDFKNLYENDKVFIDEKPVPKADIWLGDTQRRTYDKGLGLFPEGGPPGYYNTWRGFAVQPKKGNCPLFLRHINDVLCGGNKILNDYVLDWCADLFQDPGNPKGVAIVMRGDEGTGKGTFANTIGMMCQPHYTHLIDENHLTGQFNAHMTDSIVVFADEITWGGNRKSAGKLKGMTTEKYMLLERKGIDAINQRNMIHMLVASNSKWVIPAGMNSRRWLVLDVTSDHRADRPYFNALNHELDNGGKEAFLYEMMQRKITADLSFAPVTEALREQRVMSTMQDDSVINWWHRALSHERIMSEDIDNPNNTGWPTATLKSDLYDEYEEWCIKRRRHAVANNVFAKDILNFGCTSFKPTVSGARRPAFKFKPIEYMIDKFESITNIQVEKDNDE